MDHRVERHRASAGARLLRRQDPRMGGGFRRHSGRLSEPGSSKDKYHSFASLTRFLPPTEAATKNKSPESNEEDNYHFA